MSNAPEINQIHLMDARDGMQAKQEGCADVIIADPPYNIGKDFGTSQDSMPLGDYLEWSRAWIGDAMRTLSPRGTLYVYGFSEILARVLVAANPANCRWLVWHYTNKNAASAKSWQRSHESILAISHTERPIFNTDLVREPYTETFLKNAAGRTRAGTAGRFSKHGRETTYNAHEGGALPRDVIRIPALAGGAGANERVAWCRDCGTLAIGKERKAHDGHDLDTHPTQKPIALTRRLIAAAKPTGSEEQPLVLVPFSGTGAESVAAILEGCQFVGFDLNPEYVLAGNTWTADARKKTGHEQHRQSHHQETP